MSETYNEGTVSIAVNSHDVTGTDTYFKQLGNIEVGSLFTLDNGTFYQVVEVVSDNLLRIETLVTRLPYQGDAVSDTPYTLVKSFARQTNAGLANEVMAFQQMLMEHRFHFYEWLSTQNDTYTVTEDGFSIDVPTPSGLQRLNREALEQAQQIHSQKVTPSIVESIKQSQMLTVREVEHAPNEPPTNNELLIDKERQEVYVGAVDTYLKIPKGIGTRNFCMLPRGRFWRFGSKYSGTLTMRVYPFRDGGLGLPNLPDLEDFKWQEFTTEVTDLFKIGEYNSEYFTGIIDWIKLDGRWATLDADKSHYNELNLYVDNHFGTLSSPMRRFTLREDGYWYSDDMTPKTPNEIGESWTQSNNDYRTYSVVGSSSQYDGLQLLSDDFDEYDFELIVNATDIGNRVAVTNSNSQSIMLYHPGPRRFEISRDRIFFKRNNENLPITATITIESLRMRIPNE